MREVWRGYAAAWECDELGHLNVAHYLAKAMEGVAGFAIDLGLTDAFTDKAFSTVRPREIHIRFLKECRPGTPLSAFAGVYEIGGDGAGVYMELRHSATGEVSAAFRFTLNHISVRTGERFSWRADTLDQLDAAKIEPPAATAPRGVDLAVPAETDVSAARADALGMDMIGRRWASTLVLARVRRMRSTAGISSHASSANSGQARAVARFWRIRIVPICETSS